MQCELESLSQQLEQNVKEKEGQLHSVQDENNRAQLRKETLAQRIHDQKELQGCMASEGEAADQLESQREEFSEKQGTKSENRSNFRWS